MRTNTLLSYIDSPIDLKDLNKNKSLPKELKDRLIINEQKLKDIIKSIKNVKKLKTNVDDNKFIIF